MTSLEWIASSAYTEDEGTPPIQNGYFLGDGQEYRRWFQCAPISTARFGTASNAWIINKSWIFDGLLAMVYGDYSKQII